MKIEIGQSGTFEAAFMAPGGGGPAVLDEAPTISFFTSDGDAALADLVPVIVPVDAQTWSATIEVPESTSLGWYLAVWHGLVAGEDVAGSQNFQIVNADEVTPLNAEKNLRRRLNDKLEDETDDSEAFFTDDEIHFLLAAAGDDPVVAAFDGWVIKMAYFSDAVDIIESGSDRKLSQLFKQAKMMADYYRGESERLLALAQSNTQLPVAKAVNLRTGCNDVFGYGYSPFSFSSTTPYVRIFLSKRFFGLYDTIIANSWGR